MQGGLAWRPLGVAVLSFRVAAASTETGAIGACGLAALPMLQPSPILQSVPSSIATLGLVSARAWAIARLAGDRSRGATMPGPPPKHPDARRRRNASPTFRLLPFYGRKGRAPKWPLPEPPTETQLKRWRHLWRSPQATAWQDMGEIASTVAYYVLLESWSLNPDAASAIRAEARQLNDRLGLNPRAMRSLGWQIDSDAGEQASTPKVARIVDYRKRLG